MEIGRDLILKLETLAQLELTEEERRQMQGDLQQILQMVDKLQEINTEGLEPLVYLGADHSPLRTDDKPSSLPAAEALHNARFKEDPYFLVPKVIEK
ncbi:MAG TPA: Asp-tRNA(Asn)/Glu-tRNA(Gln) amidotransferase subunit GatC [Saprospiraceae bacterium]|nr:Asp-tRNA(Asn)/Glu-tRNA(Gln) amidotransferase subunit GatC [Saprospiraceae bacterium]HNT18816.1 Asp-tRNA(Asn)/Glu-tRNA(Gln) amidotransferase subunit GatC [Saprospiraceae bacterium]